MSSLFFLMSSVFRNSPTAAKSASVNTLLPLLSSALLFFFPEEALSGRLNALFFFRSSSTMAFEKVMSESVS